MSKLTSLLTTALFLGITGCALHTDNSSAGDRTRFSAGSETFLAARAIFKQSCVPCHQYEAYTEEQFKAEGLIVVGDLNSSVIYNCLKGSGGGQGKKDMPPSGSLSADQMNIIATWVQSVQ